jgi:hypothetical protein
MKRSVLAACFLLMAVDRPSADDLRSFTRIQLSDQFWE